MSGDEISINKDFIKQLCELTDNSSIDVDNITQDELDDLLEAVKTKVSVMEAVPKDLLENLDVALLGGNEPAQEFTDMGESYEETPDGEEGMQNPKKKSVLLIDDLGVIIHQLSVAFQKMDMNTVAAKEIFDALDKFKKGHFDLVIMDLFIPTDREGFMLLAEIKKFIKLRHQKTKVVVITASGKKEYKKLCLAKGADFFFEKIVGWQAKLAEVCFD